MGDYLVREQYLSKIRAGRDDTGVIKVITGMRRCGKSVIMELYAEELRRSGVPEEDFKEDMEKNPEKYSKTYSIKEVSKELFPNSE